MTLECSTGDSCRQYLRWPQEAASRRNPWSVIFLFYGFSRALLGAGSGDARSAEFLPACGKQFNINYFPGKTTAHMPGLAPHRAHGAGERWGTGTPGDCPFMNGRETTGQAVPAAKFMPARVKQYHINIFR